MAAKNGKYLRFESPYDSKNNSLSNNKNDNRFKKIKTSVFGGTQKHRRTFVLGSYQFERSKE